MTTTAPGKDRVTRQLAGDVSELAAHLTDRYVGPAPLPRVAIVTATGRKLARFALSGIMTHVRSIDDTAAMTGIWDHASGPVATLIHGVGGPSADRLLITALMQGVRAFIRIGTCGLVRSSAPIGTVLVAEEATSDDTSFGWYARALREQGRELIDGRFIASDAALAATAKHALAAELAAGAADHGRVYSTSLLLREGPGALEEYRRLGCLGADMECGSVLACAAWYQIPAIGLLIGADHIEGGAFYTSQRDRFMAGVSALRTAVDAILPVAQQHAAAIADAG